MFESAVADRRTPTLAFLAEHGSYRRAASTFPSLTPVCLSSLATGAHPDVHEIPHLVWYHRAEQRVVEYGSSFGAVVAAGTRRVAPGHDLRAQRQPPRSAGGDGLRGARGRRADGGERSTSRATAAARRTGRRCACSPARPTGRSASSSTASSSRTRQGLRWQCGTAPAGRSTRTPPSVGRWLVTRDGFDFLVFYLSDYDYASHAQGPGTAHEALSRCDGAIGSLVEAAGGEEEFLERYAVILCSDHGQTSVDRRGAAPGAPAGRSRPGVEPGGDGLLGARAARARRAARRRARGRGRPVPRGCRGGRPPRRRGAPLHAAARTASRRRATRRSSATWTASNAAWAALANPNAGELLVSAAPGLGVRRPRRAAPRGRRLPRLARSRRLGGADADGRPRAAAGLDHRRDAAGARALRRRRRRRTRARSSRHDAAGSPARPAPPPWSA